LSRRILDAAIILLAAEVLLIVTLGGIDYDWGFLRLRLHSVARPLLLLAGLVAARAWIASIDTTYAATRGLLALILAAAAVYATYHVRVCGGLDSYGYVSTSSFIASGRLTQPQPLVKYLPFDGASSAVAPLGYVAGLDGHSEVPRFPLGLPIVMALFRIFGPMGPFFVPLVMAYATIALAFLIATEIAQDSTGARLKSRPLFIGLFAAAIVAVDPLLVDYGIQPMSDVPAAAWLLAAVWLRMHRRSSIVDRRSSIEPVIAGVCAGMAFLTRPALLIAAIAIGIVTLDRPLKESVRYGATLVAFVVLQMAINLFLYGDVRTSGYGPASYMFEISGARLMANATNFGKWLTHSHTLLIWFLWPAALVILRARKPAWQISLIAAAAGVPYLFYLVFDDWESSRFILPTILLVLILAAAAVGELMAQLRLRPATESAAAVALVFIALGCAAASDRFLRQEGVYRFGALEAKYALAGEWIESHTPERAVVFAGLHSGSIRYYGNRQTIRWDQIPPDKLSVSLHNLQAAGYEPYLALDAASEPPLFDERFRGDPAVRVEQIGRVRVVNFYRFAGVP
jgi:hypothetical protein